MRLLISAGGTGGHVYPAVAVVSAWRRSQSAGQGTDGWRSQLLWIGFHEGMEAELIKREGIPFASVSGGGLRGLSLWSAGRNALRLAVGVGEARRIIERFRPDVVWATGGFACVPVVAAAWLLRRPILIYLPDIEPGLAVRLLAQLANRIAVTAEESRAYLPQSKVAVTGYPVRPGLAERDQGESRRRLGLEPARKTLLIFGGSQGAHSINVAMSNSLPDLLGECQVIHICGKLDEPWLRRRRDELTICQATRYSVYSYLHHEMLDALASADLAVARAGAATLGEFPALGLPSVLVPYPFAGGHQRRNAQYLADRGAAVLVEDRTIGGGVLGRIVIDLLADEGRLAAMRECASRLARPDAAQRIVSELQQLALGGGR